MSNENKKCNAKKLIDQATLSTDEKNLTSLQEERLNALRDYYLKHIDQFIERVQIKGDREKQILLELANNNKNDTKALVSHINNLVSTAYLLKEKLILAQKIREHRKEFKYRKSTDFVRDLGAKVNLDSFNRAEFYQLLKRENDTRLDNFDSPNAPNIRNREYRVIKKKS